MIRIGRPEHSESSPGRLMVSNRITPEGAAKHYFDERIFWAEYDYPAPDVGLSEGLLNIPAVAAVLPTAWLIGSDVEVDELDREFYFAMDRLQTEYRKFYPEVKFGTGILAKKLTYEEVGVTRKAIGFGGGLDSLYSLALHLEENPLLIFIEGWDIPVDADRFLAEFRSYYGAFAERAGLEISFIRTNVQKLCEASYPKLRLLISRETPWQGLQQAVWQTGLTAPLSAGRFNVHLTASTNRPYCTVEIPESASVNTTNLIRWSDVRCEFDGSAQRWQKLKVVKPLLDRYDLDVRVCYSQFEEFNCSHCEKCTQTIFLMLGVDMDPNDYGFRCDEATVQGLYDRIRERRDMGYYWQFHYLTARDLMPEVDMYGSLHLWSWFREHVNLKTD